MSGEKWSGSARQKDLVFTEQRIQELGAEVQKIQTTYQKYHGEVRDTIRDLLVKAGIWEEVNGLEQERAAAGKRAEERIKKIQGEAQHLQTIRSFLLGREQMDPSAETPTSEESPLEGASQEAVRGDDSEEEGPQGTVEELDAPEMMEPGDAAKRPHPPTF